MISFCKFMSLAPLVLYMQSSDGKRDVVSNVALEIEQDTSSSETVKARSKLPREKLHDSPSTNLSTAPSAQVDASLDTKLTDNLGRTSVPSKRESLNSTSVNASSSIINLLSNGNDTLWVPDHNDDVTQADEDDDHHHHHHKANPSMLVELTVAMTKKFMIMIAFASFIFIVGCGAIVLKARQGSDSIESASGSQGTAAQQLHKTAHAAAGGGARGVAVTAYGHKK